MSISLHTRITAIFQTLLPILTTNDVEHCIFYGSLLGWHRENGVIPFDSDGDLLVPKSQYETVLTTVKPLLVKAGLFVNELSAGRIIQVHDEEGCSRKGGFIDLYFFAEDERQGKPTIRNTWDHINTWREDVYPLLEIEFAGCRTFAPKKYTTVLRQLYGANYMTPNKNGSAYSSPHLFLPSRTA